MSHEKYLKKALITLGISDMIKEIPNFEKLNKLLHFLETSIIEIDYKIMQCKEVIKSYNNEKKEFEYLLENIKTMLSDINYQSKKRELLNLKEETEEGIYQINERYINSKNNLPILEKSLDDANRLISLFREVEPQCRVEEIKALNKGKNYQYFVVA